MEMTQMHLWQAQAMEGMDEDFGDGKSVSLFKFDWREGCMWIDGGRDNLLFCLIYASVEFKI